MPDVRNDGNWYFWYATTVGGEELGWLGYSDHLFFEPVTFSHRNIKNPNGIDFLECGNFVEMDGRLLFRAPDFTAHGSKFLNTDSYKLMWVWGSSAGEVSWDPMSKKVKRVGGTYDGFVMSVYGYASAKWACWENPTAKDAVKNHILFEPRYQYMP